MLHACDFLSWMEDHYTEVKIEGIQNAIILVMINQCQK